MTMSNMDLQEQEIGHRAVVMQNPRNTSALFNFAHFLHNTKHQLTEAEQIYRQILVMEAGHEQALLQLAIIRCTQKDYLESENLLRRAIHGQSKNAEVFLQLALVLLLANHNVVEAE